ncbi:MAG TPA: branched-chain amino acid ABC transporter permease, partial [Proteobacteria bacterium]|nr:branched-chain amino acid ABC transporter permease [Pseudomonadota bacterium]
MTLSQQILQYIITGVTIGSVYTLIGLGFNIIYNATEIINFAQGEFVMLGALFTISGVQLLHLPLIAACVLATLAVALVGV